MKNFFMKMILWGALTLAIAVISVIVIYRLAVMLAIGIGLLVLGLLIGPPVIMALKYKYNRAMCEMSSKYK